jgi:hypothetical protein
MATTISKEEVDNIFAAKRIEKSANKIKDFKLDLDDNVQQIKGFANVYARKDINLNFIERFTRLIYTNPYHLAKIEFIQYIFIIILLFYYNPLNINTKYPALTSLLILIVAFMYVMLYFFIKMKVAAAEDVDLVGLTEKKVLLQFIATIVFFILFMLAIKGVFWLFMHTSLLNVFRHSMSIIIVCGVLGLVYLFTKNTIKKAKNAENGNMLKFLFKVVMVVPCLMADLAEYIKYEFNLTTKPVWILAGIEAGLVGLWFVVPYALNKMLNYDSINLLTDPVNLNKEHIIGNFSSVNGSLINIDQLYNNTLNAQAKQDMAEQPPDTLDNAPAPSKNKTDPNVPSNPYLAWFYNKWKHATFLKVNFTTQPQYTDYTTNRFAYKYTLSGWFYINPQPPNTSSAYSVYTNILNYGRKINIEYNGKLNSLRVMAAMQSLGPGATPIPTDNTSAVSNTYAVGYKHAAPEDTSKYARDQETINSNNRSVLIYQTTDIVYQKWNNIVINYEDGNIDVFLNGVLVGTVAGAVPYMTFDTIVAGSPNGIIGGICNVNYYRNTLSAKTIKFNYKSLRIKNFPNV